MSLQKVNERTRELESAATTLASHVERLVQITQSDSRSLLIEEETAETDIDGTGHEAHLTVTRTLDGSPPLVASPLSQVHFRDAADTLGSLALDRTVALDPQETLAAQDFRSAKASCAPSLKRDIVLSIACTRPPAGGLAWRSTSDGENSYSHWAAQQLRGRSRRARRASACAGLAC